MTDWTLHPQLLHDTVNLGDLPLSRVLVMNDANYPWLVLVPRKGESGAQRPVRSVRYRHR